MSRNAEWAAHRSCEPGGDRPEMVYIVSLDLLPWAVILKKARRGPGSCTTAASSTTSTCFFTKEYLPPRGCAGFGKRA